MKKLKMKSLCEKTRFSLNSTTYRLANFDYQSIFCHFLLIEMLLTLAEML